MAKGGHFGPDFFRFLGDLRDHNDRHWFLAHKDRYETAVRDPFLRFVADLGPLLQKLHPPFAADPSPVGGSMMRIYRDIRFSRDKRPYKTCVAAHFRHADRKGEFAPALYLHLEPGKSGLGGGLWRPAPPVAKRIRDAIARDSSRWRRITRGRRFTSTYTLAGESYKRTPRGYAPGHPLADDLRRKDFVIGAPLTDRQIASRSFLELVIERYNTAMPLMQFLVESVGRSR
jgi:uncharacterized protein (TIGR02453 family)